MCHKCKVDNYNSKLDMMYMGKIVEPFLFYAVILISISVILKMFEISNTTIPIIIGIILVLVYVIFSPMEPGD